MKIHTQWRWHVEAWRESGLSQADYCRQQDLNPKTFSLWTRRVRRELSMDTGAPLEVIPVHVLSSLASVTTTTAEAGVMLRFPSGAQLELSTAVSPRWLAELLQCLT
jgi:predicted alpha/beta hydrolase family esterase